MVLCNSVSLLIFVILTFAATITHASKSDLTLATFNLHGFSKSSKYLNECIKSHGGIWFIQEHWLSESQLHKLQQVDAQFVARSGMEDAVSSGIYRGRPFGGVAICWSSGLSHLITPVSHFKHKRIVAVELKTADGNFLLISAYMPFYNASRREQCMTETVDAISMVDLLIEEYLHHQVIIGGDLNTELKDESPFDFLWKELMTKNRFTYCDQYVSSPAYTYRHDSLNQTKFNDHFIVSQSLLEQNIMHDHLILDEGSNMSDHLPLQLKMSPHLTKSNSIPDDTSSQKKLV